MFTLLCHVENRFLEEWCWVFTDQFELRNKTEDPERSPGYLLEGAKK